MPPRIVKRTNKTILLAVEGDTDFAFVTHLRDCYVARSCNVSIKIKNARGAGPLGIVDALTTGVRGKNYDYLAALFDADIPLCDRSARFFRQHSVKLFQSQPSIEGTLLRLKQHHLQENITTAECKRILARDYTGESVELRFYEKHFSRGVIEAGRIQGNILDLLINYIVNPGTSHNP